MQDSAAAEQVAKANFAYYEALSARDLHAMEMIWEQSIEAVNIAPPTRPVAHVGWTAVRKNYEQFWATLDRLAVSMEQPSITIRGDVAWVYGVERTQRVARDGTESGGTNYGTSIFVRRDGRWRMVLHQAAPIPAA